MPRDVRHLMSLAVLSFAVSGCATYQVGPQTLYRPDIRTVYVPAFQSDTLRRGLGERLTEAVIKEIQLSTPYKVVHRPDADSVLNVRLLSDVKQSLAEDANDNPRDIETGLTVQVSWYDRRGQFMFQDARFAFNPGGFFVAERASFVPEGGQSLATAHQEAIERLAEQIVTQMQVPW